MTVPLENAILRVVYADDEEPAREKLHHQLSLIPEIELVGWATTGKEAVSLINTEQPDVVFLDIQMPEINGLDVLALLNCEPLIIYTTAYDQYAIKAFENASIDYLLKPFSLLRLKDAVEKARVHWLGKQASAQDYEAVSSAASSVKRLVSKHGERMSILASDEVCFITSDSGQTQAFDSENAVFTLNETLDQLEVSLDPEKFVRVHRKYLINIDKVKEIQRWFNGKLMLIMQDNVKSEISTSRGGAERLKTKLRF